MKAAIIFGLRHNQNQALNGSSQPSSRLAWFSRMGRQLIHKIAHAREPQIWQSVDAQGNPWWCVYEPQTQQSYWFESEDEVRIWLDTYEVNFTN